MSRKPTLEKLYQSLIVTAAALDTLTPAEGDLIVALDVSSGTAKKVALTGIATAHAASHAAAGTDEITPASIGAAVAGAAPAAHAASHGTGQADAITPASIGAQEAIVPEANVPAPDGATGDEDVEARAAIEGILALLVAQGLMEAPSSEGGE